MTTMPSVYSLARMAECADPDSLTSPGGRFLLAVGEHVEDRRGDGDDLHDLAAEIADSAIPAYTHDLWSVFVDLGAWREDTSDLGDESGDLTRSASLALYVVAERLALALLDEG